MTTAIIGTGGIGSMIARQLASGGETLRLSSADTASAQALATRIGGAAIVAVDNRDALQGGDAVVLALRFGVLKGVIDEIGDALTAEAWSFRATRSASTHELRWYVCCRKGNPLARF
jgi:8-hydroxy-5-deazaflavin:NADPH oxidoreductase